MATVETMRRVAPNFSGRVIPGSGRVAGEETGFTSASMVAPVSKNDFLSARRVKAATSTMPAPVIQTAKGKAFHVPMRITISAANPLKPGIPMEAAEAITKVKAAKGRARDRSILDKA